MNRTLTNAIFAVVLAASAAGLATHAVADDQSGVNHYILCDKNVGCASGVGGTATPAAYRIEGLYSNLGGWSQFIELRENSTDGKVTPLAGSVITVRHGDVIKQFVIPSDPPAGFPVGRHVGHLQC